MKIFTVTFFGHRRIEHIPEIENAIESIIMKLLKEKEYVEFLVGRNGEFDIIVSSCIRRVRKIYGDGNSSLTLVLPYLTAEYINNKETFEAYYDSIEISDSATSVHPKNAIATRNKEMIDRANLTIFCVQKKGGAYTARKYAQAQGKTIINLL